MRLGWTLLVLASCSYQPPRGGAGADDPTPDAPGTQPGDDGGSPATGPCSPNAPAVSSGDRTIDHAGTPRRYKLHVPAGYAGTPTPLVFDLHGYSESAGQQRALTSMTAKADAEGFVVVHPEGLGFLQGWNAGTCCNGEDDDVDLVRTLIDALSDELCIDPKRVYSTGLSNGGAMSHRLACELSDRIAAIAPVAGTPVMTMDNCQPTRPVSVLHFHGTADAIVPYNGNALFGVPSVDATIERWTQIDGCTGSPATTFDQGDVTCTTRSGCDAGSAVTLCRVDGGGHTWPGGQPRPLYGHTTDDIDATDAIWSFFVAHPMP
jgi:polyhydroxybutyrate depolymerase